MVDVSNEMMELVFRRSQYCSVLDTMESLDRAFVQHRYHKYRDKLHSNKSNRARAWCVCMHVRACVHTCVCVRMCMRSMHIEDTDRPQVGVCHHLYTGGAGEEKIQDVVMDKHENNKVTTSRCDFDEKSFRYTTYIYT